MRCTWLLAAALPASAVGQTAPRSDAGTLRVELNGTVVATEAFQLQTDDGSLRLSVSARRGAATTIALAVFSGRRVTVRLSGAGGEIARELPYAPGTVVLDDSVFAFIALLPRAPPGPVQVLWPRTGARAHGTLTDLGREGAAHGYELVAGGRTIRAWFDGAGRLVRARLPERRLELIRATAP